VSAITRTRDACCSRMSLGFTSSPSALEHDDRRQAQDHRPDSERPNNVPGRKPLLFRIAWSLSTHDAPRASGSFDSLLYASSFPGRFAGSFALNAGVPRINQPGTPPALVSFRSAVEHQPGPGPATAQRPKGRKHQKDILASLSVIWKSDTCRLDGFNGHRPPDLLLWHLDHLNFKD